MSNFESGPALTKHDGQTLRYEDAGRPAKRKGWECVKCSRFYIGDSAEHAARYCCHTDAPCPTDGCTRRRGRHRVHCDECWHRISWERYAKLEQVNDSWAPSNLCPLAIDESDRYFFDKEDLFEYCQEHDLKPSDLKLLMCWEHSPSGFSIGEHVTDYLLEDGNVPGTPEEISAVERVVNDYFEKHRPWSWYPDHKRRPSDEVIAKLDSDFGATS